MTVEITLMKMKICVAASIDNVLRVSSAVTTTNVSQIVGAVITIMIVVISLMKKTVESINAG